MTAHQKPTKLWALTLALLFLPAAGAWAQTGGGGAPSSQIKIAIFNLREAIVTTAEGKQASAQLQSQFAAQQNDLQNMQKQNTQLQNLIRNTHGTLSGDWPARLER